LWADVATAGRLVVWHSTEDIEFLECDRVLVFSNGRIVRELVGQEISEESDRQLLLPPGRRLP
jgi:ribose transport system ATP-binding protein